MIADLLIGCGIGMFIGIAWMTWGYNKTVNASNGRMTLETPTFIPATLYHLMGMGPTPSDPLMQSFSLSPLGVESLAEGINKVVKENTHVSEVEIGGVAWVGGWSKIKD